MSTARHSREVCYIAAQCFLESFRSPTERETTQYTNAMRDVVIDFIVRQMMRRSPEDQNDPYMVGDLPLKRQKYLCEVLRREDGNQRVVNVDSDGESIFSYLAFSNGVSISDAASELFCNDLGANGAKSMIKHLKKNPPLSMLSLESCGLPSKSAKGLCNALSAIQISPI